MTTHELAAKLLEMPNIPVATHDHDLNSPHASIWRKVGLKKFAYGCKSIVIFVDEKK